MTDAEYLGQLTVGQLIEKLELYDKNTLVWMEGWDDVAMVGGVDCDQDGVVIKRE